ncbi:MAG: AarF/UbiB family protein [Bdellovibrio sp.]
MKIKFYIILIFLFVAKLVQAAAPEAVGLHLSFQQRLAITYALLAQGETEAKKEDILKRARAYFLQSSLQGVETVQVENFKQFLKLYKGDWPNTNSVKLDIEIIERKGPQPFKIYKSESHRVQGQIDRYIEWAQNEILDMALASDRISKGLQTLKKIKIHPVELLATPFGIGIAEKIILQQTETFLSKKLGELNAVGEKLSQADVGVNMDAPTRILMQTILSEYFANLSSDSKKLIASSFLGENLYGGDFKKFEIMVQNSGPVLQKFFQIMAREESLNPKLREVFVMLEDAIRPVPWIQVEEIFNKEKDNYDFVSFSHEELAVGSVGQVHRAKIKSDNVTVPTVVRFIKPGIEFRVEEDKTIFKKIAAVLDANSEFKKTGMPKITPVIEYVIKTVEAELIQENTVTLQQQAVNPYGKKVLVNLPGYKTYLQFHVPLVYPSKRNNSQFMVQEMVLGSKLDKEVEKYKEIPGLKKAIVEEMAKVWCYEVLFAGGLYHSDLHQGNFLINVTEPQIDVNILDFGMGGVVPKVLQRQMMVLGAGIELVDPQLIARGYWSISDKKQNSLNEQQFKNLVEERVKSVKGTPEATSLERWTSWAMDSGINLPYEFVSLNRGVITVNKLLKYAGSNFTVTSLMKVIGMQNPLIVYKRLVLEEKLSNEDLVKLGFNEIKKMVFKQKGNSTAKLKTASETSSSEAPRCESVFH